jgi:hypothetical protein
VADGAKDDKALLLVEEVLDALGFREARSHSGDGHDAMEEGDAEEVVRLEPEERSGSLEQCDEEYEREKCVRERVHVRKGPNVWHQRRAQRVRCMPGLGGATGRSRDAGIWREEPRVAHEDAVAKNDVSLPAFRRAVDLIGTVPPVGPERPHLVAVVGEDAQKWLVPGIGVRKNSEVRGYEIRGEVPNWMAARKGW